MVIKSLLVFVGVGVISGLLFGIYLADMKQTSQIVFTEGPALSIIAEKHEFKKGEPIKIRIVNSGTEPLSFASLNYGMTVTGLSGMLMYSPLAEGAGVKLEPRQEKVLVWDQVKNGGDMAKVGVYKIQVEGFCCESTIVESVTVTIT